jgi:hypothetical protein
MTGNLNGYKRAGPRNNKRPEMGLFEMIINIGD